MEYYFKVQRARLGALLLPEAVSVLVRPGQSADIGLVEECITRDIYGLAAIWHRGDRITSIVDVGANIGIATRIFRHLWPKAHVLAMEPDQRIAGLLRRNAGAAVDVVMAAAGYGATAAAFHPGAQWHTVGFLDHGENDFRTFQHAHLSPRTVSVVPPEKSLSRFGIRHIDLLKLDCEGSEFHILRNLTITPRIIVGEWHGQNGPERLTDLLARLGRYRLLVNPVAFNVGIFWAELHESPS